jgi:NAD(P)-dependent dehydrogenase (short-subunit alcohol dehydrogenase family)
MLLEDKNAVIYGGGGSIGGAVAKAFAREGARVHLAGRTKATLDAVADEIRAAGGQADTAEVDALDEAAVDAHADAIGGGIDISFNVIGLNDIQGTPLAEMALADFMAPIETALRSQFLTTRAAARHMIPRGSGVILTFGGEGDPIRDYSIGGLQIGFHAVEALRRQLATELGRHGIRTVTLRSGGVPETIPEGFEARDRIAEMLEGATLLGRTATLEDIGNVAAFVASDQGRTMTAATVNVSCGALLD